MEVGYRDAPLMKMDQFNDEATNPKIGALNMAFFFRWVCGFKKIMYNCFTYLNA